MPQTEKLDCFTSVHKLKKETEQNERKQENKGGTTRIEHI